MILAFTLTMPTAGSWNGKWSGAEFLHARTRTFPNSKASRDRVSKLIGKSFSYHWTDGWSALVEVREVDRAEAARLRRKSRGFAGYDWMIDSILANGRIETRETT